MAVEDTLRWQRNTPLSAKVGTNFAGKRRSLCRYSSLADSVHGVLRARKVSEERYWWQEHVYRVKVSWIVNI
jgi:hypothetical protein